MAIMIPDRIPTGASMGEKNVFAALQHLPDDCVCYYEPIVGTRYPDFIVIIPDTGVLIIEVKGWYPKHILRADSHDVVIQDGRGEKVHSHPNRQAREYMYLLMDRCRELGGQNLLHSSGKHEGRFIFPFGFMSILSNIESTQLQSHVLGDLMQVFPEERVMYRETMQQMASMNSQEILACLKGYFTPTWNFPRLTEDQIHCLRAIVHPNILIHSSTQHQAAPAARDGRFAGRIKVLDMKQENLALNIGEGHRIIHGAAGSGKTLILLARARNLASANPEARILLTCYNTTLAAYFQMVLDDVRSVHAYHFDAVAKGLGVVRRAATRESDEAFGRRFLEHLGMNPLQEDQKYDAILIDEGQDFPADWYRCILELAKDPLDGDLVVVGDANQGLYRRQRLRWKDVNIQARGRTISKKFDLHKNYRNSAEILEMAVRFAENEASLDDEEFLRKSVPESESERSGYAPLIKKCTNRNEEHRTITDIIRDLLQGRFNGQVLPEPLRPGDIRVLYRANTNDNSLADLIATLSEAAEVLWVNDSAKRTNKLDHASNQIRLQTIHSSKGLQAKAVVLVHADQLPLSISADKESEQSLMYVALTRAEQFLAVTYTGESEYTERLMDTGQSS